MLKISFVFLMLFSVDVLAAPFVAGHNIAITTDLPPKGTATVGTYMAGYSFSDSFHLATCPWMAWGYNSYSLIGRLRLFGENSWVDESTLQVGYVKNDKSLGDYYRQEVGIVWWSFKNKINDMYTFYTTLNYMYFWDETLPFSLRREPGNNEPYQFTISTLQQVRWSPTAGFQFEFGVLGINYRIPEIHNGYSFYKIWDNWLTQVGLSITASPNNFDRLYAKSSSQVTTAGTYDYSVHPEIQLQYFF